MFMTLEEQIQKLTAERDEEKAIVDRVWAALGISTYEQAKPLAIDEHVKRIIAERDAARADLKAIGECVGGEPLAVRGLVESMDAVIKERDAAQKQVAEMRDTLSENLKCIVGDYGCPACKTRTEELLKRTDCGKGYVKANSLRCFKCDDGHTPLYCLNCAREGYHHDDEWRPVVEALRYTAYQRLPLGNTVMETLPEHWQQRVYEALAHAEKLTSK